jgi:hypothetical protein
MRKRMDMEMMRQEVMGQEKGRPSKTEDGIPAILWSIHWSGDMNPMSLESTFSRATGSDDNDTPIPLSSYYYLYKLYVLWINFYSMLLIFSWVVSSSHLFVCDKLKNLPFTPLFILIWFDLKGNVNFNLLY